MVQLLQKNHSRINCRNRRIVTLRRRLVVVRLFQWKENGGGRVGNHHRKGGVHGHTSLILFRYGRMNFQCIMHIPHTYRIYVYIDNTGISNGTSTSRFGCHFFVPGLESRVVLCLDTL